MPTNRLTARIVAQAKPQSRLYKLGDGHGLYLAVLPTGAKSWRMAYRLAGRQQTHTIGPYPEISLAQAREMALEARRKILAGSRPGRSISGQSFEQAARKYWTGRAAVSEGYWSNALAALEHYAFPAIGSMPLRSIERADVMRVLTPMDEAGKYVYVRKVRLWISQVFDWAVEHGHADINPAASIRTEHAFGRRRVQNFPSLPLAEFPAFVSALNQMEPNIAVLATRFLMLTWCRTSEVRQLVWSDVEGDLLTIPAERMKASRDHLVPLSDSALAIVEKLRLFQRSDYLFPSPRNYSFTLSENAILAVIKRLGYGGRMTGHGFRSVASTWANEQAQARPDVIEMALAHAPRDNVRSAYNRAQYLPERRLLLQAWADWVHEQAK